MNFRARSAGGPPQKNNMQNDLASRVSLSMAEAFLVLAQPLAPMQLSTAMVATCRVVAPKGTKSRESINGASIRASAERAREARKEADKLA
jgi:hypothetical protein